MAKNKQQDQTFEEILKAQQMEMLDSEEEDNFQCTQNSGDEENKNEERPTAEIELNNSKIMADNKDEDEEDCKSISSTDQKEEIDSSAANKEVEKISHQQNTALEKQTSNLENDEEEAKDSSEPFSIEIIMNSSYDDESGDEELKKEQQIESAANIPAEKGKIDNVKEEIEVKKLTKVEGSAASTNNSNVVSSEDFKGIRDLNQQFSEGLLPKSVLNKIKLINHKYTTEELRKMRKNRNAEQWKDYLWKNHGCDWPIADEPFELDPELRVPYWKKLQIRRQREDEAKRWYGILGQNNTSNAAAASKPAPFVEHTDFSPVKEFYPSKNSNNNKGVTGGKQQQQSSLQFGQPPIHVQKSGYGQTWTLPFINRISNCQPRPSPISQQKKKNKKKKGNGNNNNANDDAVSSAAVKKAPIENKEQQKLLNKAEKKQLAAEMDWTDSSSSDECEEFSAADEDEEKTCTDEEWASAISNFDKQGNEGTSSPQKQKKSPENCFVECVPSNSTKQSAKREKRKKQKEKARLEREKNGIAVQPADQSTSANDFPYSSPPHIQAQWVQSQPLFQSYIAGVNKIIQELSGTTI